MISRGSLPFISAWMYRRTLKQIIRRAVHGESDSVTKLADVFCTASDPKAREFARRGLSGLSTADQMDLLCRIILTCDYPDLVALAGRCGFAPSDPTDRELYHVHISALTDPDTFNPDVDYSLLARGYARASVQARACVRRAARLRGTGWILTRSLTGTPAARQAGTWSYDEWDLVIDSLVQEKKCAELWSLAPHVPISLAVKGITAIKESGWAPKGDDLQLWQEITTKLPVRWNYPVPERNAGTRIGRIATHVTRTCFSPDSTLFATGTCDRRYTVYRMNSAGQIHEIPSLSGPARYLALSADNSWAVYGGEDGKIHGYNLQEDRLSWSWERNKPASAVTLSSEPHSVVIGDENGTLSILDLRDGWETGSITAHPSPVFCIARVPDTAVIICGHLDGTVSVGDFGNDRNSIILPGNTSRVCSLPVGEQGKEVLAIYEHSSPVLWDTTTGEKIRTFQGLSGQTICSASFPENTWFAIGSNDRFLRLWSRNDPQPVASIPLYNRHVTYCSAVPDGSLLAVCFHDGTIRIYRMPGSDLVREFRGHKKTITSCTISPDGRRLATISWDGTTRLWRIPEGEIVRTWDAHQGRIVALAGPANNLIATVTTDGIARFYEGMNGTPVRTIDLYTLHIRAAAISDDGTCFASAGENATIRYKMSVTEAWLQQVRTWAHRSGVAGSYRIIQDSSPGDGTARVVSSGSRICIFSGHFPGIQVLLPAVQSPVTAPSS